MLTSAAAILLPQAGQVPYSAIGLCVVAAVVLTSIIVQAISSPLASIPGTRLSRWTNIPLRLATARGERHRYVHALHSRYGPVVRLAPNEVSVTERSALKQMYKMGSKFWKSPWYLDFTGNPETVTLFATLNDADHAQHRRLVANNFADKTIRSLEPDVAKHTKTAVQGMEREMKQNGYTDVFKWFVLMANDVICQASFVETFGMLEKGEKTDLVNDVLGISRSCMIRTQSPLLSSVLNHLSPEKYGSALRTISRLETYSTESLKRYQQHLESAPSEDSVRPTLLSKMFSHVKSGSLSPDQIRMEGVSYIIAGTETTAVTATFAVWFLALHPEYEERVRREVAGLAEGFGDGELAALPTLCNSISETLRLRTPVSQSLPRVTPPEGLKVGEFFVPGGTEIGAPAWTLHREERVWEDAERFWPERWENETREMKENFVPFGAGSRICLGIHLAQMELRYVLANFYRTFSSGVKPALRDGFSSEEMRTRSYFVILPEDYDDAYGTAAKPAVAISL